MKYLVIRKLLLFITFLIIILDLFLSLILPFIISRLIDNYLIENKKNLFLVGVVSFFLLSFFCKRFMMFFSQIFLANIGEEALYNLRSDSYKKLQELDMVYYNKTSKGEILSRMTNDLDSISTILSGQIIFAVYSILLLVGFLGIMVSISPILMFFSAIIFPLYILTIVLNKKFARPQRKIYREQLGKVSSVMTENITGAKVSSSFARSKANLEEFTKINQAFSDSLLTYFKIDALISPLNGNFRELTKLFILIIGSYLIIISNSSVLTVGTLFLFLLYIDRFIFPIWILTNLYNEIQLAFASFERIIEILDHPVAVKEKPYSLPLQINEGKIEIKDLTFSYDNVEVFKNFNLAINPNKSLAIVGETGAGKSTLISLISRLYDVQEGSITIDGQNIKDITLSSLRNKIGVVLQDPILFSESIRYNLCCGVDVPDEKLINILTLLGADFVFGLPSGLNTVVGERGGRLSLGQKQLISFARTLITDPKILLLDEATSSIDPQAEINTQKAMKKMMENRTNIIIAHRLSTVSQVNEIIVLDQGKIIERGSFNQLLELKRHFYELYNLQFI
jgi:ATP-binding cassette subfamily B protein